MAELYTEDMGKGEILENCILSKRARSTYYLCSEIATYIGSGKEIEGNNMEDKRKQMRTDLHI